MSLDDELRRSLDAAAASHQPGSPPADSLHAAVARRRRSKTLLAGTIASLAMLSGVGLAVANANRDSTPRAQLDAAGGETATTYYDQLPPVGSFGGGETTTTTTAGASGTAGTAYAPPASVVYPTATTSEPPPGPTTTSTIASGDNVAIGSDDNGKTFTVRKGQHLTVTLDDGGSIWSEPDTDNSAVVRRTAVSANPSSSHVTASFLAESAGQAHVSASRDAACRAANPPCMVPTQLWQVTINVV
jgi:hypothetical protein